MKTPAWHANQRSQFAELHAEGLFVLPNPWDVGSAALFAGLGFEAVATTSSGFAAALGRTDQNVSRAEVVDHVAALASAIDIPVNVDGEDCFPREPGGISETAIQLVAAGAAGFSIEDYDPVTGEILSIEEATDRVGQICAVTKGSECLITARAENHLRGHDHLEDTIARLNAYHEVGATCLYAPGITDLQAIARIVDETSGPINVLAYPGGPTIDQLRQVGVRRVSTGGSLAKAAFSAAASGAKELLGPGTSDYASGTLSWTDLGTLFSLKDQTS